ncbi:uncharacterized protein IL334_003128 [Kwoniella shivajii]|uniref:C2H2-type domain-containing protein n=1 Tax=Kwoniella shivajii TaxID=564305 RepID=A0ABZ1CWN8_9TREE|nr:hypothetical protein IL334_003128 [Kwoniella shivajii]
MNDQHYSSQAGGYDGRGAPDGRERRDQYQQQQQQQQTYQQQPPPQSPPTSASPFAFAPPPLSSIPGSGTSRPTFQAHHSEPNGTSQQYSYQQYQQKPAAPMHHNTYPSYATSAPMGYRSYSGETERQSPIQPPLTRTPSLTIVPTSSVPSQSSPMTSSPYSPYQRQTPSNQYGTPGNQMQTSPRAGAYPPPNYYTTPYSSQPTSSDMPRSLSYPSAYSAAPYPTYHPSISAPSTLQQPPLLRHNTMAAPTMGMDMRQNPNLGYSFANRLPLVDRPFKCDECVQSFNRNHDLKRHKRIHLDVKPFGCDKCGKTFSRKDALRRHWLVKGCRGEEGATAPITPMYPINSQSQVPALSPPTPEHANISPMNHSPNTGLPSTMSFSHPSAPPALSTLPPRDSSETSQIIVTPDEIAQQQQMSRSISDMGVPPALDEPLVIDPSFGQNGRNADASGGYFEGVVGIKNDGTAMIDNGSEQSSPYNRFPNSPSNPNHHHPYRRPSAMPSPGRQMSSPTVPIGNRSFAPGTLGADGKPVFAMPFTPTGQTYNLQQHDGLLAPPLETGQKMEKTMSADGMPESWQRWHRPSFPFPPPPGVGFTYDPSSPIDAAGQGYSQ